MSGLREELEQVRREKEQLENQLACLQRSATLGELLGTTTHEFNNVLMTIMNYAKLGLRNKDEASRDKALGKILAASERAAKITHSVLGMARNRKDGFEPTQLAELLQESLLLLERELQRYRVHVELELESVPDVPVNGNQIQQVLVNLLVNARQAMPDGGRLVIRIRPDREGRHVELSVRDYGVGIQLLKDLGLRRVRLLTNNPKKTDAFIYGGFDLEVVDQVPILPPANAFNERYLATKREKLGHRFPD